MIHRLNDLSKLTKLINDGVNLKLGLLIPNSVYLPL